jgi:hypothetical protein
MFLDEGDSRYPRVGGGAGILGYLNRVAEDVDRTLVLAEPRPNDSLNDEGISE